MKGRLRGVLVGLQQFTVFLAAICFALLGIYSIGVTPIYRQVGGGSIYSNYYFHVDLFSGEEELADTQIFNSMLLNTLEAVIRYNVAKSQLETDGFFDVDKEIDILSFVNRKETMGVNGSEGENTFSGQIAISKKEICYTVGDLLKWVQYGISYDIQSVTVKEFLTYYPISRDLIEWGAGALNAEEQEALERAYLQEFSPSEETAVEVINVEEELARFRELLADWANVWIITQDGVSDTVPFLHGLAKMLIAGDCGISSIYIDEETGDLMVRFRRLEERYKPQGMQTLMACADSWAQYQLLTDYLERTIHDISYNYGEYQSLKQRYQEGATNLVYDFQMTMLGEVVEVSNLPDSVPEAERDAYFKEHYGKYIIYQPGSILLDTNLPYLQTEELFSAFFAYSYAYPETARIWIGVDTTYPVEDVFAKVNGDYMLLRPYANMILGLGISCILIWGVFLVLLSILQKPKEVQGAAFYKLPTEFLLLSFLLYVWGVIVVCFILWNITDWLYYLVNFRHQLVWLAGLMGLIVSGLFCLLWYAVIKKIKLHRWFADSLLVRLCKVIKRQCVQIIGNTNIWLKNFLLWGGIMLFNFLIGQALSWFWLRRHTLRMLVLLAFLIVVDICVIFALFYHKVKRRRIEEGIKRIGNGELDYRVDTADLYGENRKLAEAVNTLGSSVRTAVETSMKDERLKADLITNVSHDIKTPLTSIINYVDLLKREKIENEPIKGYIAVLDSKSQRLKQLTEDLLEASKISSGNITLNLEKIQVTELIKQALGEFSERFAEKQLMIVEGFPGRDVSIYADSRRIWRVVENLLGNVCKYAMPGTRIYLDMAVDEEKKQVGISIKNISAQPLNIPAKELTERFIRGDVSRSTEGSGLGLSIAKSLTELQNGSFDIYLDGDLFKVTLVFPLYEEPAEAL